MELVDYIFLPLLAAPAVFYLMGLAFLLRYLARPRPAPDPLTPVTILKPLAGRSRTMERSIESFLKQSHSRYQLVLGVGTPDDPARSVVEEILKNHPSADAALSIAGEPIGPNRKVTNMHYMLARGKYDLIMICDDDVVVAPDYVERMVGEMREPQVGLATSTYWMRPTSLPLALHALTMTTEFFPSVVTAEALERGLSFALGPSSIMRRKLLEDIGGFPHLSNFLAEDYLMGAVGRQKGWKIRLSREMVQIDDDCKTFADFFLHQLRWSRTYRACRPGGFFWSVLTQGTFFALLYVLAAQASALSLWTAGSLLGLRLITSALEFALIGTPLHFVWLWMVPLRDLLSFLFWLLSFTGSSVRWRDHRYRVTSQGRLEPIP
jgi:ceramide glucosyltransferase